MVTHDPVAARTPTGCCSSPTAASSTRCADPTADSVLERMKGFELVGRRTLMLRVTLRGLQGHKLRLLLTVFVRDARRRVRRRHASCSPTASTARSRASSIRAPRGSTSRCAASRSATPARRRATSRSASELPLSLASELRRCPESPGSRRHPGQRRSSSARTARRSATAARPASASLPPRTTRRCTWSRAAPRRAPARSSLETSTLALSKLHVGDRTRALIGGRPQRGDRRRRGVVRRRAARAPPSWPSTSRRPSGCSPRTARFRRSPSRPRTGVDREDLRARVAQVLPASAEAVTGVDRRPRRPRSGIRDALGFISVFLLVFAAVSVVVGAFIIFNTFSMLVAQRTRELALLRAVGAERGQVVRAVVGEAVSSVWRARCSASASAWGLPRRSWPSSGPSA